MKRIFILILMVAIVFSTQSIVFKAKANNYSVYYFSDNSNCQSFKNQLVNDYGINSNEIALYDWSDTINGYVYYFNNNYTLLSTLEYVYVIFEFSRDFLSYSVDGITPFVDTLCTIFGTLQENGCHILFISSTDEIEYRSRNDFLDYVDFHIMTDTRLNFVMNIFYYIETNNGNPPQDLDLLFGNQFLSFFGGYSNFKTKYLLPYINTRYYDYITNNYTQAEALSYNDFGIYYQTTNNASHNYKSIVNNQLYSVDDFIFTNSIYCVGASSSFDLESQLWLQDMDDLYPNYGFYYNYYSFNYCSYTGNFGSFCSYNPFSNVSPTLIEMTYDFIENFSDCYIYDNWGGRCDITHMMLNVGPNGWMYCFYGNGSFYNCWDAYNAVDEDNFPLLESFYYDDSSLY